MFVLICFRPDSSRLFEVRWLQKVSNMFQYESEKLRQHDGEAANHHLKSSRTLKSSPGWDIHHLESWQISAQNKMPAQKIHVKLPIKFVVSNLHLIKKSLRHSWTQTIVPHESILPPQPDKIPYIFGQCIQMLLNRLIFGAQLLALSGRSLLQTAVHREIQGVFFDCLFEGFPVFPIRSDSKSCILEDFGRHHLHQGAHIPPTNDSFTKHPCE